MLRGWLNFSCRSLCFTFTHAGGYLTQMVHMSFHANMMCAAWETLVRDENTSDFFNPSSTLLFKSRLFNSLCALMYFSGCSPCYKSRKCLTAFASNLCSRPQWKCPASTVQSSCWWPLRAHFKSCSTQHLGSNLPLIRGVFWSTRSKRRCSLDIMLGSGPQLGCLLLGSDDLGLWQHVLG